MNRKIVLYGDPVLSKIAEPVRKIDTSLSQLIGEMAEAMEKAQGVGIAAPQVGVSIQLAIVDVPPDMGGIGRLVLINPKIISAYGTEISEEGCLSAPGIQVKVKRYKELVLETLNISGKTVTYKAGGFLARAIQHEIDHLNGILIVDKLAPVRRVLIKRKMARKAVHKKEEM